MSDPAAEEMESAEQAMSDASVLRNHGGSNDAIANRLYYACYHAAKAVLYTKGHQPQSHAGVISLFGEELVKNGAASQADRKFLARAQTRRERADYGNESVRVDTEGTVRSN